MTTGILSSNDEKIKIEQQMLWEHFKYHATQRIETFKIFLILSGAISTGFGVIFSKAGIHRNELIATAHYYAAKPAVIQEDIQKVQELLPDILHVLLAVSIALIIISIVFWILDYRNNTIINIAKNKIIEMENDAQFKYKIFNAVKKDSEVHNSIRYHHCFGAVFLSFILLGLGLSIFSLYKMYLGY